MPSLTSSLQRVAPACSIVQCARLLQDADYVPDNAVDVGEARMADDDVESPSLHYLWVVDARSLGETPLSTPRAAVGEHGTEGVQEGGDTADEDAEVKAPRDVQSP